MFVSKNLPPTPVWFSQVPLDTSDGWVEGAPTNSQQVLAIRSVIYSDGSSLRWYRMAAVKKDKTRNKKGKKEIR
jgi:hypothetical protein